VIEARPITSESAVKALGTQYLSGGSAKERRKYHLRGSAASGRALGELRAVSRTSGQRSAVSGQLQNRIPDPDLDPDLDPS
jgi:hypothetical protein